ncbi:methylated-DNA--[protein]-cysteine S-methyltransferase [Limnohabitans sp. TEGF004]|uniref:methylated-DNA--[protein]-cysteine S-methyltransferase n=1 Tax=Limnohabitans sp. TEGF004 TaxID=2986281 RepID=UPI002377C536|nr:methylated-DNA--[protein]-cysteine S-methyltransferase [Limnohabitans sp. TEGF004]BDU54960.1 methylated-DNA--protein-cysteine methyltransferase [Limnohabitans sp. TEGF004]
MSAKPTNLIYQSHTTSPLGDVLLAATPQGLAGVWFVHRQEHLPDSRQWVTDNAHPTLMAAATQLREYFDGQRQTFEIELQPAWGTPFQRAVWRALQRIPYGHTSTYGGIAHDIDKPKAVRAVGAAIGQNPHSIIVPCHRVLGANGSLTGFAGGLDRKKHLLALEATHA